MNRYEMGEYDVIVVGAGHAGCEAALAPARMGLSTLMLSITLEAVAMMPCNPSVGGTGKGHLVREIDALGGEMGVNTDKAFIQSRMLNTAKGPAVHSLRAQADKQLYHEEMKKTIERQENLDMKQAEAVEIITENGRAVHCYKNRRRLPWEGGDHRCGNFSEGKNFYRGIRLLLRSQRHGSVHRTFRQPAGSWDSHEEV